MRTLIALVALTLMTACTIPMAPPCGMEELTISHNGDKIIVDTCQVDYIPN